MSWPDAIALIALLRWPLFACFILAVFRAPITNLINSFRAGDVTAKLEAMGQKMEVTRLGVVAAQLERTEIEVNESSNREIFASDHAQATDGASLEASGAGSSTGVASLSPCSAILSGQGEIASPISSGLDVTSKVPIYASLIRPRLITSPEVKIAATTAPAMAIYVVALELEVFIREIVGLAGGKPYPPDFSGAVDRNIDFLLEIGLLDALTASNLRTVLSVREDAAIFRDDSEELARLANRFIDTYAVLERLVNRKMRHFFDATSS